jgi:hypothetical protein
MPDLRSCTCSEVHTRAICDEVGERLRVLLDRTKTPTPPRLLVLLLQLQQQEFEAASADAPQRRGVSAAA